MAIASGIPPALQELALQLLKPIGKGEASEEPGNTEWLGMATLIAPNLAVTPTQTLRGSGIESGPLIVRRLRSGNVRGKLFQTLNEFELSLILLDGNLSMEHAGPALSPSDRRADPARALYWEAAVAFPSGEEPRLASGMTSGIYKVLNRVYVKLEVKESPKEAKGFLGGPVLMNERVFGIVTRPKEFEAGWYVQELTEEVISRLRLAEQASSVAGAQRTQPQFAPARFFDRLSPSSRTAIGHADGMRQWSKQDRIHMEHLILGLFLKQDGPADRLFRAANIGNFQALTRTLARAVELRLPAPDEYTPTSPKLLPRRSGHVEAAFMAAQAIADSRGSPAIQSRHLLYGALSIAKCSVIKALLEKGVRPEDIHLDETSRPESLLTPIIGAASDRPDGDDLLELSNEIDALSALVASQDTKTPLSIGLFGDWGSGKSFFMQKMDEQVRKFRDAARTSPKDSPFCPNIVQLWFNAWHYMDQSLWASLLAEIFEGLANNLAQEKGSKRDRKDLEDARTTLLAQQASLESEHASAKQAALKSDAAVQLQVDAIRAIATLSDRDIERSLGTKATTKELIRIIEAQPEIKAQLDKVGKQIGLPELQTEGAAARAQVEELVGIASYWKSALQTARSKTSAKWWLLGVAIAGVILTVGASWLETAQGLKRIVTILSTGLTALLALLTPVLAVARRATMVIRDVNQGMKQQIEKARQSALATAEQQRQEAADKAEADRRRLADLQQQLEAIDRQLGQLRPSRQLTDFIRHRHASDEYTKHFGVIARARLDFEELTRLMELVRDQPQLAAGSGGEPLPQIDRIVLYIDDLDRCREKKVFEVLQAVHLLLAFPLFIVVVGVDPRWLLHSLRHQLGAFRDQPDEEVEGEEGQIHWRSTPLNYLEKIFQIPFSVRPMAEGGYERMIDELTKITPQAPHGGTPNTSAGSPDTRPPTGEVQETDRPVAPTANGRSGTHEEPSTPADQPVHSKLESAERGRQAHERLQLEEWERSYLKQLFPLVLTPRAAKRLVNVYRLLRAMTPGTQRKALIGDESGGGYRPVLLLLAMVTGFPPEASRIIRRLLDEPGSDSPALDWWTFLAEFQTTVAAPDREEQSARSRPGARKGKGKRTRADSAAHPGDGDAERWAQLFDKLKRFRANAEVEFTYEDMAYWAPLVARYSFASGRLLQEDKPAWRPSDRLISRQS